MSSYQQGQILVHQKKVLENFDVEISRGVAWLGLNDHTNYRVDANEFGSHAQQRKRIEAESPFYDGSYLVHSTLSNIQEMVNVYVYGASQNHVTENILLLEELFSEPVYNLRITMDDHVETWSCQPADYTIDRTHVQAHNVQALMRLSIPRLPRPSYEVNL